MNRSKSRGTAAETAVVRYLCAEGWQCERRTLSGSLDKGDIAGIPGVVIEVKDHASMGLAGWVAEAQREAENAGVPIGVVWHKRRGKGNPKDWYVTMTGREFVQLMNAARPA